MERKAGENTIFTYIKGFFLCLLPLVTLKQLVFDPKTVEPSDLKETLGSYISYFFVQFHPWIKHKVTRIKEMREGENKNSPCHHLKKCIENSMENMLTDVRVLKVDKPCL